jgi:DNA-binding NarL/FixJ family response regulator
MRILVLQNDALSLAQIDAQLSSDQTFSIAARCGSFAQAQRAAQTTAFEIAVVDLALPDGDAFELIAHLKARAPGVRILIWSARADEAAAVRALRIGASGYVLKNDDRISLLTALRIVREGGVPISGDVAGHLLRFIRAEMRDGPISNAPKLTKTELTVLRSIASGKSYRQAAAELGMSAATVPSHIKSIYRKLEVHNRGAALFRALELGFLDDSRIRRSPDGTL